MTFDNTTYDQLAEMTADVLAQVVAAEPEVTRVQGQKKQKLSDNNICSYKVINR